MNFRGIKYNNQVYLLSWDLVPFRSNWHKTNVKTNPFIRNLSNDLSDKPGSF